MADDGDALHLSRPARLARFYFIAPGEPRDIKTLEALASAALAESRDALFTDPKAAALLETIGRTGSDRHVKALEEYVADRIAAIMTDPPQRQRVKSVIVRFDAVPQPRKSAVYGTLRLYAWRHTLRSTFDFYTQRTPR